MMEHYEKGGKFVARCNNEIKKRNVNSQSHTTYTFAFSKHQNSNTKQISL